MDYKKSILTILLVIGAINIYGQRRTPVSVMGSFNSIGNTTNTISSIRNNSAQAEYYEELNRARRESREYINIIIDILEHHIEWQTNTKTVYSALIDSNKLNSDEIKETRKAIINIDADIKWAKETINELKSNYVNR